VSNATAATLPALIGQTRVAGSGVIAGALRDCQNHEVSGFIATISSTSGTATTLDGADTYYFSPTVGLPVHHSQAHYGSKDGLFMIIQVPTSSPTGYVQMWGFPTDADLAMGMAGLQLVAELQVPVLGDTVITGSYEPLRTP
jgi:phosphoribosylcarboxyaminoimidazole (NCAIR) mutase